MNKRNVLIGLALLVLAAVAAYIGWDRHQTRQLQDATLAKIDTATRALRDAGKPSSAPLTEQAQRITGSATQVDTALDALRDTGTTRISQLAAGADSYLLTVRELLRRQAAMLKYRASISVDILALREHLLTANRAAASWTSRAVQIKNRLEQNFREFQRTVDAHTTIIDGMPEVRRTLMPLMAENRLVSDAETAAMRKDALDAAKTLTEEVHAVRQIAAPR